MVIFSLIMYNGSVARSGIWQLRRRLMSGVSAKVECTCKPSAYESEIYPSHKTPFYALCISPLQGAKVSVADLTNAIAFVIVPDTARGS